MNKYKVYTAYHPYQGYIVAQDIELEIVQNIAQAIACRLCADIDIYEREYNPDDETFDEGGIVWCTSVI